MWVIVIKYNYWESNSYWYWRKWLVFSKILIKYIIYRIKLIYLERNDSKYINYYESVIIIDVEESD